VWQKYDILWILNSWLVNAAKENNLTFYAK